MKKLKQLLAKLRTKKSKGFTLIEMVIVIAIIAILLILIVPNLTQQKQKADQKTTEAFRTTIQAQVDLASDDGKTVTFAELESDNYITKKQKEKAEKLFIIKDGSVETIKQDGAK
ncbi:competence type IV pilus major pilin ComGC [Lactobacillus psittaci]|uniref:Prepilin-type N-terminal cleavage/methylation domain-containing protein n=1 Tax=Lactobacillus psittaci DSM 15354 TaxID=1122152 RepID=A0A0R1SCA9_9LACO|nr:competence type IV pilus major pilin ComGC [Lactobacillus psittaci]KRL63941.1 hypothetical protein FC23_GL000188 [Lactobacillus psittaci DSM 15354]